MTHTIHQPRHARTEPPREDSAVIIQFPGSDPMAEPDISFFSAVAADLVRIGATPEAVRSLPGLHPETRAGLSALMARHAAAGVAAILHAAAT